MKKPGKKFTDFALLLLLAAVWFGIGWVARGLTLSPEIRLVEQVRRGLLENYPFELPSTRALTYGAIRGLLLQSGDPHAALLEPAVSERFDEDFSGGAGVIGIVAEARDDEIVVTYLFPGEPAEQSGMKTGDVLLSVDGVLFDRFTTETEASILIRGPVGAAAHIVARRDGQVLEFDPIREERIIATGQMLDGGVAYLAQSRFTGNSPERVKAELQALLAQNPKGLVWDLRGNGGGSMDAAQQILSYWIPDGLLFKAELKGGQVREFPALGENSLAPDLPLVVLVNENTYSSAETCAAALQERGRGRLVGSTTHGKGTIQNTVLLLDGSRLQFTLAKWLSPAGEWFEGRGVAPDVEVVDDPATPQDEVLQRAIELLQSN